MKRWFLSPVIGTGTDDDPYRAALLDRTLARGGPVRSVVCEIASDPVTGAPLAPWALCVASGRDLTGLAGLPQTYELPDITKDATASTLTGAKRNEVNAALSARGIAVRVVPSTPWREVLRGVGRALNPAFHEDRLDVPDAEE